MSIYCNLHVFSSVFIRSVGRSFATRYHNGLESALSFGSVAESSNISNGSIEARGCLLAQFVVSLVLLPLW